MVSVIGNWIEIAGITWILGYWFVRVSSRFIREKKVEQNHVGYMFFGLMVATVYAEAYSCFAKVGALSHVVLLVFCAILYIIYMMQNKLGRQIKKMQVPVLCLLVLILIFSYGTSRGYIHYDTSLYHAQSIRWVEEYGLVKGLGNLQSRFAYNSAAFPLSALFSLKWLTGTSLHTIPGFMALLLSIECIRPFWQKDVRKEYEANLVRVAAMLYILSIFTEMISPASDYFTVLAIFYILIRWFSVKEENAYSYALLCFLIIWTITMKLSAGILLLLIIKPLVLMRKKVSEKRSSKAKELFLYVIASLVIVLPFLVRNFYISGWLLYPFPKLDVFQVTWKVPEQMAVYDYQEIATFARGVGVDSYGQQIMTWLPEWFSEQASIYKLFLLADLAAVVLWIILIVVYAHKKIRNMKLQDTHLKNYLFTTGVLMAALIFWFVTSPSIRFGIAFVFTFPIVMFGKLWMQFPMGEKLRRNVLYTICAVLLVYKLVACIQSCGYYAKNAYWIWQKPYDTFEVGTYQVGKTNIYYPLNGDQAGYEAFPSSERQREDLGLLNGENISGGFYDINESKNP